MDVVALVTAIVGVALGVASLAWQAATFVLSGSRVKVTLRRGALSPDGSAKVSGPLNPTEDALASMRAQGFTRDVLIIDARNIGRMPVSVERAAADSKTGWGFEWPGDRSNLAFPHRLEPGAKASWHIPMEFLWRLAEVTGQAHQVWMTIELGNGKVVRTKDSINILPSAPRLE
jgi:hypothetical protein